MFTHRSDTRFETAKNNAFSRSLNQTSSLMLAAASLLFSDNQVRFAQNNAFTEQEVSCHAPEP